MEITNELLAVYAEGKATEEERKAVRQYLTVNPEKLGTVLMMMDEDYDLDFPDESETGETISLETKDSFSDISYSAAAFAPRKVPIRKTGSMQEIIDSKIVSRRLGDLLDEIDSLEL